ncbi:hypothetical protein Tco_0401328 [Tanacetum coccineum]
MYDHLLSYHIKMDSVIPLGQKNTHAEYMILSGTDNRPPMLDKDLYDSWKSRMELYMQNREHGRMILESVEHGPLIWPMVEENGVTRTKKYDELSDAEKIQVDCDMKATNIILQGLPADIYSLVNHHRVAKDLWERVQLLMQGISLTKHERECKLYDTFDKFTHIKGESLHNKFVTDVKLVKDLHTTNFNHLHAYLEQHELHVNEVRLMRERNQDPLALIVNQQMTPPHFNTYQSSYNNPQYQQQFSPSQYGSIHPPQHYSSTYQSQPQFNHSTVLPSYPFQSQMNHQTSSVPQIAYQSPQSSTQPMIELPLVDSCLAVPVFFPGDDPIACLNKAMSFLTAVASSRVTVQQVHGRQGQSYYGTSYKGNATSLGEIMQVDRQGLLNATTVKTEDLDTYDSDCDDILNAKVVLMANISNYGSDVISEVPHSETYLNDIENQSVHAMHDFKHTPVVDFIDNEIHIL